MLHHPGNPGTASGIVVAPRDVRDRLAQAALAVVGLATIVVTTRVFERGALSDVGLDWWRMLPDLAGGLARYWVIGGEASLPAPF